MKVCTLAFLLRENEICLALKKRGFGEGYWNGYGGKVEEGESIESGIIREIKEESGVSVREADLEKVALNNFYFQDGTHLEVHAYFVREWVGEPCETEEMSPRWYTYDAIPYDLMWADDIHWLPRALRGAKLRGIVHFHADGQNLTSAEFEEVVQFD